MSDIEIGLDVIKALAENETAKQQRLADELAARQASNKIQTDLQIGKETATKLSGRTPPRY